MDRIARLEQGMLKESVPQFNVGNTVRVHVKIKEGEKERIQIFEGVVIRRKGTRNRETFTVRKVAYNVAVERIFPVHSPWIAKVEVIRVGAVRRAKLYYLRQRTGRAARLREKERVRPSKSSK
ncbi:MAG: 50S ribosomal protein L19 [Nitrospira sp.]|nr:50S ribosomal protein L19 [Candidatus Manganitrophaceae bacterium]HIL34554.1 50S ribosomal protein L19 [Candidatus Manganitrophaceae bacterium]